MTQHITGAKTRIGTCPHGMPIGACPICNGSSGGSRTKSPGEMTWSQCFAAGIMMKNKREAAQERKESALHNIDVAINMKQGIEKISNNIKQTISILQNSLPEPLSKIVTLFNQILIKPLLSILDKIPQVMQTIKTMGENIRLLISQVCEKLTAFFGEVQNFINRKFSDSIKKATKKVFGFLFRQGMDEENLSKENESLEVFSSKKEG